MLTHNQSLHESLEKTTLLIYPGHVWGDAELPYCYFFPGAEGTILVQGLALTLCALRDGLVTNGCN